MLRQKSKQMAGELCRNNILCRNTRFKNWQMSYVTTKESLSRQEMRRSQLRQISVMLRHNERQEGRIYVVTEFTLSRH